MGYDVNPNDSDLRMATVVLQYGVFPTEYYTGIKKGDYYEP